MPSFPLEPGRIVGHDFVLERPLASGGMGTVFVALQRSTGVRRALKLMNPEIVRDAGLRERFAREARVGASIPSDHIVQVISAGIDEDSSLPFLVLELLDGQELASLVEQRGPIESRGWRSSSNNCATGSAPHMPWESSIAT
jgi:eukaryotic-like serine/threonine-protein kinase